MTRTSETSTSLSIGFIGGGKMAEALAAAMTAKNAVPRENLLISDPVEGRRTYLKEKYNFKTTDSNTGVAAFADVLFLAVKPQQMEPVLTAIAPEVTDSHLVISIAAGIRIRRLQEALPAARVIRVMPNTPCLVGEMAAGYAADDNVSAGDIALVEKLLDAAGTAIRVEEELIDAVTGLSGSGPAFVAHLIDAFIQGGINEGLSAETARELTLQTFSGTAKLLRESGMTADELITQVSSPGGTTIAGRNILENEPVRDIIARTITAAAKRSRELAES